MKKTVILSKSFGGHSNCLIQSVNFEAYCLENAYNFVDISILDLRRLYAKTTAAAPCLAQSRPSFASRMLASKIANKVITKITKIPGSVAEFESATRYPVNFVCGWDFRVPHLTIKYQDYFARRYSLNPGFLASVPLADRIKAWKQSGKKVIGVHIRRGDYIGWKGGIYYFSDEMYVRQVNRLCGLLVGQGRDFEVVVFSNEEHAISEQIDCHVSRNEWYVDHYLMSCCDYILGPPSTFSMWASFIGKAKYFHFSNQRPDFGLDDFGYCDLS